MIDINRILTQVMSGSMGQTDHVHSGPAGADHTEPLSSGSVTPMFESRTQLPSITQQPVVGSGLLGHAGTLGAGALAGGLAGVLLSSKRMREVAGTAVQIGAVAAIGGLAYKAYQNYRQGRPIVPQSIADMLGNSQRQTPVAGVEQHQSAETWIPPKDRAESVSTLLLSTMVAAAVADGHLDTIEYGRIREQLRTSGLNEDEQLFLSWVMKNPSSIQQLAAAANTLELRVEVYAVARLAIEPDSPAEREWLDQLATALQLEPGLRAHLDAIGSTKQARAA